MKMATQNDRLSAAAIVLSASTAPHQADRSNKQPERALHRQSQAGEANKNNSKPFLIGFSRDEHGRIQKIVSDSNAITSDRQLNPDTPFTFANWNSKVNMGIIPLEVKKARFRSFKTTQDFQYIPEHITAIFKDGNLLMTSKFPSSDYSVLMNIKDDGSGTKAIEGRTGVLLYKNEPVVATIDGKDYVIELKGVGAWNGDNNIEEPMSRSSYFELNGKEKVGGLDVNDGKLEFNNLETIRKEKTPSYSEGGIPRAAALITYADDTPYDYGKAHPQAYLMRLAPGSVRSSFNGNHDLPQVKDKPDVIAECRAGQLAEYLKMSSPILHHTPHPENFVLAGNRYCLTDFADARKVRDIETPHELLRIVMAHVTEISGLTKKGEEAFYRKLAQNLGVELGDSEKVTAKEAADSIWKGFLGPIVFKLRKQKNIVRDSRMEEFRKYPVNPELVIKQVTKEIPKKLRKLREQHDELKTQMAEFEKEKAELEALKGNGREAQRYLNERAGRRAFSTEKDALEGMKNKIEQKDETIEYYKGEIRSLEIKIAKLEKGKENIDKIVNEGTVSANELFKLRCYIGQAISYLENELDVFSTVDENESRNSITAAKSKLEMAMNDMTGMYAVLDKLQKNPDYFMKLIELP
ncbi:MAG: hypothetical protein WC717_02910 [Candidatus Micrarchaeia archaeon]|jgi:prefoldin subunit 5